MMTNFSLPNLLLTLLVIALIIAAIVWFVRAWRTSSRTRTDLPVPERDAGTGDR